MSPISDFNQPLDASATITVVVGPDNSNKTYHFPRALLYKVPWFEKALREDRFRASIEGRLTLPEDSPQAFEMLRYYFYTGSIHFKHLIHDSQTDPQIEEKLNLCLATWICGDKYNIPDLQNACMMRACDILVSKPQCTFSPAAVESCYDKTSQGSPLRTLLAQWLVDRHHANETLPIHDYAEQLAPHDGFLQDILAAQKARTVWPGHFPRRKRPHRYRGWFVVEQGQLEWQDWTDYARWDVED